MEFCDRGGATGHAVGAALMACEICGAGMYTPQLREPVPGMIASLLGRELELHPYCKRSRA